MDKCKLKQLYQNLEYLYQFILKQGVTEGEAVAVVNQNGEFLFLLGILLDYDYSWNCIFTDSLDGYVRFLFSCDIGHVFGEGIPEVEMLREDISVCFSEPDKLSPNNYKMMEQVEFIAKDNDAWPEINQYLGGYLSQFPDEDGLECLAQIVEFCLEGKHQKDLEKGFALAKSATMKDVGAITTFIWDERQNTLTLTNPLLLENKLEDWELDLFPAEFAPIHLSELERFRITKKYDVLEGAVVQVTLEASEETYIDAQGHVMPQYEMGMYTEDGTCWLLLRFNELTAITMQDILVEFIRNYKAIPEAFITGGINNLRVASALKLLVEDLGSNLILSYDGEEMNNLPIDLEEEVKSKQLLDQSFEDYEDLIDFEDFSEATLDNEINGVTNLADLITNQIYSTNEPVVEEEKQYRDNIVQFPKYKKQKDEN